MTALKRLFIALPIRLRLFYGYTLAFLLVIALGYLLLFIFIRREVERNIESELTNTTALIRDLVKIAADTAIKNYLRAVAENNLDLVEGYYEKYRCGLASEEKAKIEAAQMIINQRIGRTGYVYCLDSRGVIRVHPEAGLMNADLSGFAFIREQTRKKNGYIKYEWVNPGESRARPKALYMAYFEPWDWIISASAYREEFKDLIDVRDLREGILSIKFGRTGYPYVINSSGLLIIHPRLQGTNIINSTDSSGRMFIKEMCRRKNGKIIYPWRNPGEPKPRLKLVIFSYLPEFDWIVASSSYLEEFYRPLRVVTYAILAMAAMTVLLMFPTTWWLGAMIARPIKILTQKMSAGVFGDLTSRMDESQGGEIGRLSAYYNDFMDRIQESQARLRESEERYRKIFENSLDGIYQARPDGTPMRVNKAMAEIFGFKDSEEFMTSVRNIGDELYADKKRRDDLIAKLRDKGRETGFEAELVRKDGKRFWGKLNVQAFFDSKGEIDYFEGMVQDVTSQRVARKALKEAKERAEEANRLKSDFLSMVSHEMRTPLTSVVGFAKMIRRRYLDILRPKLDLSDPLVRKTLRQLTENLDVMVSEGDRLTGLINNVLDLSKLEAGKMSFDMRPLKAGEIISLALPLVREGIEEKGLELKVEIEPDTPRVIGDKERVQQVMLNLLSNALKFTSQGSISVRAKRVNGFVEFCVADTGPGISQDHLGLVFDRFYQLGEILTDKPRGTGIGLAICKEIIERHNGRIWAESREKQGSSFKFVLPSVKEAG